jgi:hypothetical protein
MSTNKNINDIIYDFYIDDILNLPIKILSIK